MKPILDICAAASLPQRSVAEGECILDEGLKDGALYILKEGAVEVLKKDIQVNVVSSPGSVFGEVSVLLDRPHMATVKALKPSTFYVADKAQEFLHHHPEINLAIARLLATRLNSVTNYLVDLKDQFESREDHLGMVDEVLESILHHHETKDL